MWIRLAEIGDALRNRARFKTCHVDHARGRRGEDIAHRFLQRAGIVVVSRNYRTETGSGEIDLVGWEKGTLVFVEVKARQTDEYGPPDRAIGLEKKQALVRAARDYTRRSQVGWDRVRFDVVNVVLSAPPAITHIRGAFKPDIRLNS